jgi:hypothetical protein
MRKNLKSRPNQAIYLQTLRSMTPEQRLEKAFELTRLADDLSMQGIRNRYPDLDDAALKVKARSIKDRCHNRNF